MLTNLYSLRRRFEQNQTDCTYTVLALLPTAAEDILEALPVEELTQELQRKRAERISKSSAAGDTTSSELSSAAPSNADEDRRSLSSSFQSDAYMRASQSSDFPPRTEADGEAPSKPKRSKAQLWKEVKITCMQLLHLYIYMPVPC